MLVVSDGANRYILICLPQKKDSLLTKKSVAISILTILALSSVFSAMATKMNMDLKVYSESREVVTNYGWDIGFIVVRGRRYTWIPYVVLKIIVSAMVSAFQIFLTVRVEATLRDGIRFLRLNDSLSASKRAEAYAKIIRYSILICCILVLYNLCVQSVEIALMARHHMHANWMKNYLFGRNRSWEDVLVVSKLATHILICMKPFCYAAAWIWFRFHVSN